MKTYDHHFDFTERDEEVSIDSEPMVLIVASSYLDEQSDLIKEKKRIAQRIYQQTRRNAAFAILGDVCARCGFEDRRALQIDHINGGGSAEKKAITRMYYNIVIESVLAAEGKYQLLCANCNWIKRSENHEVSGSGLRDI